jgi:hypothetical protein
MHLVCNKSYSTHRLQQLSSQGHINYGKTLDRKLGARTRILPSTVWAAVSRTIDFRDEQ